MPPPVPRQINAMPTELHLTSANSNEEHEIEFLRGAQERNGGTAARDGCLDDDGAYDG